MRALCGDIQKWGGGGGVVVLTSIIIICILCGLCLLYNHERIFFAYIFAMSSCLRTTDSLCVCVCSELAQWNNNKPRRRILGLCDGPINPPFRVSGMEQRGTAAESSTPVTAVAVDGGRVNIRKGCSIATTTIVSSSSSSSST